MNNKWSGAKNQKVEEMAKTHEKGKRMEMKKRIDYETAKYKWCVLEKENEEHKVNEILQM